MACILTIQIELSSLDGYDIELTFNYSACILTNLIELSSWDRYDIELTFNYSACILTTLIELCSLDRYDVEVTFTFSAYLNNPNQVLYSFKIHCYVYEFKHYRRIKFNHLI